jgi:hypothetical protein
MIKILGAMFGFLADCIMGLIMASLGASIAIAIYNHGTSLYIFTDPRLVFGLIIISVCWGVLSLLSDYQAALAKLLDMAIEVVWTSLKKLLSKSI